MDLRQVVSMTALVSLLWLYTGAFLHAQPSDPCAKVERKFPQTIQSIRDWSDMYQAYRKFSVCQRPYMYEGFANVVVHLAATRWQDLPDCKRLTVTDPEFGNFVVDHIGPVDYYELKSIVEHAQLETRQDLKEFGNRLAAKAQKLLDAAQYTMEPAEVSDYERTGKANIK
jgi:hypothetical protein